MTSLFSFQRFSQQLFPFCLLGACVAFVIAICVLLSYVLVWGVCIGIVLWIFTKIKAYFNTRTVPTPTSHKGRIIEHQD